MVSNRDIGFVKPGQTAEIKVDTFTYTRYGLLRGKVESLSPDAVSPDKREDAPNARPTGLDKDASAAADTGAREPVYSARVSLEKTSMVIDDQPTELAPGMAVTVEIKTGSRRIICIPPLPAHALRPREHEGAVVREAVADQVADAYSDVRQFSIPNETAPTRSRARLARSGEWPRDHDRRLDRSADRLGNRVAI